MFRLPRSLVALSIGALLSMPILAPAAEHDAPHWSYSGKTGPATWGKLEEDFGTCGLGTAQSPIDIHDSAVKKADLPTIQFDYKASPLKIIDNGHTIQVNYAPGSSITVGGKQYELVQFHFHKPSEEKINGKNFAMVAHLVHKDADGKLAVVAVLLSTGHDNPFIKTLWANLPNDKEMEHAVDAVTINVADLLPKDRAYYTFTGSLTTPPCSEGVTWFVLKHPASISKSEVARFGKSYPMNARPVQPVNGREITASK
ncbi:MAG TPA: carbonic anhydrase family protein [Burkholderiaceae bacterium]|nr:carbonic anhydrase family protein [Burkholderiaceae bacterium]